MLRLFKNNDNGAVAYLFALAAIPLILVVGVAIDLGKGISARTKIQTALDAGALAAAATNLEEAERIALAEKVYWQNVGDAGQGSTPNYSVGTDAITADVNMMVDNSFMKIVGLNQNQVEASSRVELPKDRPAEVALVMDYSSSMNSNGKWQAMRDAALDLVDVLSEQQTNSQVKFSLVPFAKMVAVDLPAEYMVEESQNSPWTGSGCAQDRKWPYNTEDSTPDEFNDDTKWGALGQAQGTCAQMASHNLKILPLTNNHASVVSKLNAMDPFVGTHISLGLEFGWHVISSNAPFSEGVAYNAPDVLKAIVLLTDGRQTTKAWGQNESYNTSNGEENLEVMCEAIKDKNVLLITVAFDLSDGGTRTRLTNCATSSAYFFDADTNSQLAAAFTEIGKLLKGKIYVSK